ncbi:MAG: STAS domain-containing protein [Phycisphaerales bacterium JB063]
MKITYEDHGPVTVLSVKGELSIDDADRFRREAMQRLDEDVRDFVLDFEQLDFIDSRGLETLLWLQDRCAELLGQVRIASCPDHVSKVLEITRLAARFECHDNVEHAIQSLDAQ